VTSHMLCIQVEGPRVTDMGALSRRVVLATKQEQGPVFARRAKRWTCMLSCRIPGSTPYGTPITTVEMSNAWAVRRRARLVIGHGGLVGRDAGPVRGQAVPAPDVAQAELRAQARDDRAQVVRPALRASACCNCGCSPAHAGTC